MFDVTLDLFYRVPNKYRGPRCLQGDYYKYKWEKCYFLELKKAFDVTTDLYYRVLYRGLLYMNIEGQGVYKVTTINVSDRGKYIVNL